ncbi:MAG: hypothetical protein DMF23_15495 [Verrucomicrobia bacterium]|nr:MAG: hypothetical protein DMF23_15495 [Verrucomicrobiota bacterium]
MEVAGSKVFPEPIDGERLISTIERSVRMFSDAPDLFHVLDILQMCCLSKRSGAVQMVSGSNVGTAYLRDGQIVHAETATECGDAALFEIVSWGEIEFAYDRSVHAGVETIKKAWKALLIDALEEGRRRALPVWRQQTA